MEFEDKFIAFIDILGFKELVNLAESDNGITLADLNDLVQMLGTSEDSDKFRQYGPTMCPNSTYERKDLHFRVTQISDCSIISSEISAAGAINLISYCWGIVINLLFKGVMCRGYITRGKIYHDGNFIVGTGYQNAFKNESGVTAFKRTADEKGTPFVEIDATVVNYISSLNDPCIKEMYSRLVKSDDQVTALFPFQRLSHSFSIGGFGQEKLDADKEKVSNNVMRNNLQGLKSKLMKYVDSSNKSAVLKVEHYLAAIDEQLAICDKTDEMIDVLCSPFPRRYVDKIVHNE